MNPVILLVDDNAIQGATRKAILERSGHTVSIAPNGSAAMEYLSIEEMTRSLGMIITDHLMPGMNGPELVAEIRRRGISLPILVLSGLPDAGEAYEGLDVTFLLKPLPPEALIEVARRLLSPQPISRTA
jgi:CheY-like chemotaxis protein